MQGEQRIDARGLHSRNALLAQSVEHLHGKEGVDGSSPSEGFEKGLDSRRRERARRARPRFDRGRPSPRLGQDGQDRGRSAMPTPRVRTGSPRSPYRSPSAPPGAQRPRQAQQHARGQRTCPRPESRAARTDRPARARARVARTPARRHGSASPGPPRRSAHREPTRAALPRTAAPAQGHRPETRSNRSASPIQPMPPCAGSPLPSDGDRRRRDPHLPFRLHGVPPGPATGRRVVARRPLRPRRLPDRCGEEPLLPAARADARRRDGRRVAADRADEGSDRPARAPGRRRGAARLEPRRE